jgi:methanogenic corrinoid protein MtbC1
MTKIPILEWIRGAEVEQSMEEFDHTSEMGEPHGGRRDHRGDSDGVDMGQSAHMAGVFTRAANPWKARLERVIHREVLPRLMLSLGAQGSLETKQDQHHQQDGPSLAVWLDDFVHLLLKPDPDEALTFVEKMRAEGGVNHAIVLELLAPAARRLGNLWDHDDCDFMEVAVGVQRLQRILRVLSPVRSCGEGGDGGRSRVLLLPAPGETHLFGIAIVEKFFQDAGWDVTQSNEHDFLGKLSASWFDVVGFSMSYTRNRERLQNAVAAARRRSANPDLRVLVGGPAFLDNPELVRLVGADAMAMDAPSAVVSAVNLINRQAFV